MKASVVVFPGSNCDRDIAVALEKFQIKNEMVWHNETNLPKSDLVVLPGGFSYGDYLRTGCIASKSKILNEVIKHGKNGGLILGVCNGFQILIESGLLPGALLRNTKLKFLSKNVFLKVLNTNNNFCSNYKNKNIINLPIAHNEGNFFADTELLKKLEDNNLIAFKYCDENGKIESNSNPNGSLNNIAGILNDKKNILGMMPHPERVIDPYLSGEDGSIMFTSLLKSH
jgi:phosphoribosylformylglycinamidine synthase|tara:strand:+ start:4436 stop:5119 length:684 start_codon:yes stop_codon:yes gene_type:complete